MGLHCLNGLQETIRLKHFPLGNV